MKDYEALSKKHFDGQAAEYDQRDTYYYSQNGKISCRDIAEQIKNVPYEALLDVGCGTGFLIDLLPGCWERNSKPLWETCGARRWRKRCGSRRS